MKEGKIHIYCGDGKGKTTAAVGLAVRASGCGFRVVFVQFLKGGATGEPASLALLENIRMMRLSRPYGFTWTLSETETAQLTADQNALLDKAEALCGDGERTLLVLDEALGALSTGTLSRTAVMEFLRGKPDALEVVLTGRNPDEELLALADYVSEVRKVKHPMDEGVMAREGIEY